MRVNCQFYVGPGNCAWCHHPEDTHRYRPCRLCAGFTFLPDPSDRTSRNRNLPTWLWRQTDCRCVEHSTSGWVDRTTGMPATITENTNA